MIIFFIVILLLVVSLMGYLLYTLHIRVEKISKNQAIMVEWCETLRENEEQLLKDFKNLQHEYQAFQKEIQSK